MEIVEKLNRDMVQNTELDIKQVEVLTPDMFLIMGTDFSNADEINRPNLTYWQDASRRLKTNKVAFADG